MAKTYVFTVAQHLEQTVRKIYKWGRFTVNYLTPAQVLYLNDVTTGYESSWGEAAPDWVQWRGQK